MAKQTSKLLIAVALVLFLLVPLGFIMLNMGGTAASVEASLGSPLTISPPAIVSSSVVQEAPEPGTKIETKPLELESVAVEEVVAPEDIVPELVATSQYAYITLMHGVDDSFRYRGFLYNAIVMKKLLIDKFRSKADFVLMVGYTFDPEVSSSNPDIQADLAMLADHGIKVLQLPRLLPENARGEDKVGFAEMALLKITPWRLTQYRRLQYLDGDIMPFENMDSYFKMEMVPGAVAAGKEELNCFNSGSASPINSGWFLCSPNVEVYKDLKQLAIHRLAQPWDREVGWGIPITTYGAPLMRPWERRSAVKEWEFNGASLDQGLFLYYFTILPQSDGTVTIPGRTRAEPAPTTITRHLLHIDTVTARLYSYSANGGLRVGEFASSVGTAAAMMRLDYEQPPQSKFVHFTGQRKPWVLIQRMYEKYDAFKPSSVTGGSDVSFDDLIPYNQRQLPTGKKGVVSVPDIKLIKAWLHEVDAAHIRWNDAGVGQPGILSSRTMSMFQKFGSPLGYFAANK